MAKVYLEPTDTLFTIQNNNVKVFGNNEHQKVIVAEGVVGFEGDQNLEEVEFKKSSADYTYEQAGNQLKVFLDGSLIAILPLQGDTDGTKLVFSNGSTEGTFANGVMKIGGASSSAGSDGVGSFEPKEVIKTAPTPTPTPSPEPSPSPSPAPSPAPDTTPPSLTSSTPTDNAVSVAVGENIVLNFSETVTAVTGKNITIKKTSDDSTVTTIDAADAQVSVSGSAVTINPTSDLAANTECYVLIEAGAFRDGSSNGYAGISSATALSFTTAASSSAITYTPFATTTLDSSDASTALVIDSTYMIVGDDEANALRVYDRSGGAAVAEWSFATDLGIAANELDLEASAQIGSTLYFLGSHSNSSGGGEQNNREYLFSATITGTGAATTFTYVGKYSNLESDLATWDSSNAHGKGANYYGLTASSTSGVAPEAVNGFSIEGMAASADGTKLFLAFRAPQTSASAREKALIVPVEVTGLIGGSSATFGAPVELNLGGRGIRSIEKASDGSGYLIIAGPAGAASSSVANDFRLFTWDGSSSTVTELNNDLDSLLSSTSGSFETIAGLTSINTGTAVELLQDNGDTVWSGKSVSTASKSLPAAEQQFQGNWINLGSTVTDSTAPLYEALSPTKDSINIAVGSNFVITFNEAVKAGSGNFVIKKTSDDSVVQTISAADTTQVGYAYNKVTINPTSDLNNSVQYYIEADTGSVVDHSGNQWAGLHKSDSTQYGFTTAAATTTLNAGDILFVGANADSTDAFAFVLLKDVLVGTQIGFSDRNYSSSTGMPATGESAFMWTADTAYKAGTIVTIQPDVSAGTNPTADKGSVQGAGGGIGASGETIYAFQGSIASLADGAAGAITADRWLASINVGGAAAGDIPTDISTATANISFTQDNARYNGVFDVTAAYIAATTTNIKNTANYTTSDSTAFTLTNNGFFPKYDLLITEVNSNAMGGDFFELYNYGSTSIDLSGWKWIDSAGTWSTSTAIGSVTIAAGEKLVVVSETTDTTSFTTAWGSMSNVVASNGAGLGKQDAVVVFDAQGRVVVAFNYHNTVSVNASDGQTIASVARTDGASVVLDQHAGKAMGGSDAKASAIWDGVSTSSPTYKSATAGAFGAYSQATSANGTGSPGVVGIDLKGTAGDDMLTSTANLDTMSGLAGNNSFVFATGSYGSLAPSVNVFDTISDWSAGTNKIDFGATTLTLVSEGVDTSAGQAAISATGLASFHTDDDTLAERIVAVEAGMTAATQTAGEVAVFAQGSDSYVFVSDGVAGVGANDVLIKILGVAVSTGLVVTAGDITAIS